MNYLYKLIFKWSKGSVQPIFHIGYVEDYVDSKGRTMVKPFYQIGQERFSVLDYEIKKAKEMMPGKELMMSKGYFVSGKWKKI